MVCAQAPNGYFSFVQATDSTFDYMVENFKFRALPEFFAARGTCPSFSHDARVNAHDASLLLSFTFRFVYETDLSATYQLPRNQYVPYQFVEAGTFHFARISRSPACIRLRA